MAPEGSDAKIPDQLPTAFDRIIKYHSQTLTEIQKSVGEKVFTNFTKTILHQVPRAHNWEKIMHKFMTQLDL
jgi:hypothetical protein